MEPSESELESELETGGSDEEGWTVTVTGGSVTVTVVGPHKVG